MALRFRSIPNPQKEHILSFSIMPLEWHILLKSHLMTRELKRLACIRAAEREVTGQGYQYDNDHNQYIKSVC